MIRTERVGKRGLLAVFDNLGSLGTNSYIISAESATYIIDTGFGLEHGKWLREQADASKPIVVINSHYHWDHVGGNAAFPGSLIIAHSICRELIDTRWDTMWEKNRGYASGELRKCLPTVVFNQELRFPDDGIRLFHCPGHTVDGIAVLDEHDRVLAAGDAVGDTIEGPVPELTESPGIYRTSVLAMKAADFDTLVSGHNRVLDRSFLDVILERLASIG